jgi:hypothetical protein
MSTLTMSGNVVSVVMKSSLTLSKRLRKRVQEEYSPQSCNHPNYRTGYQEMKLFAQRFRTKLIFPQTYEDQNEEDDNSERPRLNVKIVENHMMVFLQAEGSGRSLGFVELGK